MENKQTCDGCGKSCERITYTKDDVGLCSRCLEMTSPVEVRCISTGQHASTGKWYAQCYSPRCGQYEQWGQTELAALQSLKAFVDVQGDIWPPVTYACESTN